MIIKRIAAVFFALAFLSAIGVFTHYLSDFLPKYMAKIGVIIFGGIALVLNLIAFRFDRENENSNPIFWVGAIIAFLGFVLKIFHLKYSQYILIAGFFVIGMSYFFNPFKQKEEENSDLLDQ